MNPEELAHKLGGATRVGNAWSAHCPAHDDKNPSLDITVGSHQALVYICRAGCSNSAVTEAMKSRGLWPSGNGNEKPPRPLTVAEYAAHVGLPEKFLRDSFQLSDSPGGMIIPYPPPKGGLATGQRIRIGLTGKKRFRWTKGATPTAYNVGRRRTSDELFIAEGESDVQTLTFYGFDALGIPGNGLGKVLESEHLQGVRKPYLIRESDPGGDSFIANMASRLRELGFDGQVFVVVMPTAAKDPNALHKQVGVDRFKAAFAELISKAEPLDLSKHYERRVGPYLESATALFYVKPAADGVTESLIRLANFRAEITADVRKDDGVESTREFEIRAEVAGRTSTFRVLARQFPALNWVGEQLGAKAIISATTSADKRIREAIQQFSTPVERQVFAHTGWREINELWVYLHTAGGIDRDGLRTDIEVELPPNLAHFELPAPIEGAELIEAIKLEVQLFELGPIEIIAPNFCAIYRAVLKSCDFSLFLVGRTGAFKTEIAALVMQHFGSGFDSRHLPGNWSSTANALESLTFTAKDAPLVVDDYSPTGSTVDRQRLNQTADRIFRNTGNGAGRDRLASDLTSRPGKNPRGLPVATGEELANGHSARGRLLVTEIKKGDINAMILSECQQHAAAGVYAKVMSAFLRWLAPQLDEVLTKYSVRYSKLRAMASEEQGHARTPGIVADLRFGAELFFRFAIDVGAISQEDAAQHLKAIWAALLKTSSAQAQHVRERDPVERFLTLLNSAITAGSAHFASITGRHPENPEAWGWRPDRLGTLEPYGARVGWIDGVDIYLDPDSSFRAAQAVATDGSNVSVSAQTLKRRLAEAGQLASREEGRQTLTIRKSIEGRRRDVLHLRVSALAPEVDL